jgi:hypothetical protein
MSTIAAGFISSLQGDVDRGWSIIGTLLCYEIAFIHGQDIADNFFGMHFGDVC